MRTTDKEGSIKGKLISRLTRRKESVFAHVWGGTLYVYKDCYGDKYLGYGDYPKKFCKI